MTDAATTPATKSPFTSRTFIGLFVTLLFTVLERFDVRLPIEQGEVVNVIAQIAGLVLAAYGRTKATKAISIKPGAAKVALAFLLAGGFAFAGPVGCASQTALTADASPAQKVYALQGDYNAALYVAAGLIDSGHLDTAAVQTLRHLDNVAYAALRDAQRAVRAGNDPAWPAALAAARKAVEALADFVEHRKQEK